MVAQSTKLEAVDDPLGPLGAANAPPAPAADAPPPTPQKEQMVIRTTMAPQQTRKSSAQDPHRVFEDTPEAQKGGRNPPPVEAAQPSSVRSTMHPSVGIEQAARPTFSIAVGDPVKIGDLTSSHIVYSVRTKVRQ